MADRIAVFTFKEECTQLTRILEPIARACKCLESSEATLADVYLFWLAVLATYEKIISNNGNIDGLRLPNSVIEDIRKIVNARWDQAVGGPNKGIYLTALFLDPRKSSFGACSLLPLRLYNTAIGYLASPIFRRKTVNPISTAITLRPSGHSTSRHARTKEEQRLIDTIPAFSVAGKYLMQILTEEIRARTHPKIFGHYENAHAIGDAFRHQFTAYVLQEDPFRYMQDVTPREFWMNLSKDPRASLIAVSSLSIS